METKELTPKQKRFADEYLIDLNATAAYKRAGYAGKGKTADVNASRMLANAKVASYIAKKQGKLSEKLDLRAEDVLRELARIVYADPRKAFDANGHLLPVNQWPDDVAAMISSIESDEIKGEGGVVIGVTRKIKMWDKNAAIEKAMKHLGQFERDNKQKSGIEAMDDAALEKFIARKTQQLGKTMH